MTQAELWNMQLLAAANASESFQGVVTIIFAYLVTAYFVGRRLTHFQMEQLTSQFGVESISPNAVVIPLYAVLMALLIPASVFFMYQIRGNPQLGRVEASDPGERMRVLAAQSIGQLWSVSEPRRGGGREIVTGQEYRLTAGRRNHDIQGRPAMDVPIIRAAAERERPAVLDVITLAFATDPVARWAQPNPTKYFSEFRVWADALGGGGLAHGATLVANGLEGAAMWLPPGVDPDVERVAELATVAFQGQHLADVMSLFEQMGGYHPQEPCWYLPLVGVDPILQVADSVGS